VGVGVGDCDADQRASMPPRSAGSALPNCVGDCDADQRLLDFALMSHNLDKGLGREDADSSRCSFAFSFEV
jgi:hypothetical protein